LQSFLIQNLTTNNKNSNNKSNAFTRDNIRDKD
jgi:hypothetical protein